MFKAPEYTNEMIDNMSDDELDDALNEVIMLNDSAVKYIRARIN